MSSLDTTDYLDFYWTPCSGCTYTVNTYINNKLQKPIFTKEESIRLENLQEGDCAQVVVRKHQNGLNLGIHYASETQCVPVTNFNEHNQFISLNTFTIGEQSFEFSKISNRLYSGVYEYEKCSNSISIQAKTPPGNSIIKDVDSEPFIKNCYYKTSNGDTLNVGSNLTIPEHAFNSNNDYGTFVVNDVYGESVTGIIQYMPISHQVKNVKLNWSDKNEELACCSISPNISNNLKSFEYSLYSDPDHCNLYLTGTSVNGLAKINLDYNKDFYLKIKPKPANLSSKEYVHPTAIFFKKNKPHNLNKNQIKSVVVYSKNVGQYSISASTEESNNNNSYFQLTTLSNDQHIVSSGIYGNNIQNHTINTVHNGNFLDELHINLELYDKETNTLLDTAHRSILAQQPEIRKLSVDFDYHLGLHQLNIQTNFNIQPNSLFDIYYSGLEDVDPVLYTGQEIKSYNKNAEYNVYITSKNFDHKLAESSISSRALAPRIILGNKSNTYFPNQAIFHITNAYQRVDNISNIKVYRGPIGILESGSALCESQAVNNVCNINISPESFYKNIAIGDFIDAPDETTHESSLYTGHYKRGTYEETFTYYSGQSYQSIFVPVNAFEAGSPVKIKYNLGLKN